MTGIEVIIVATKTYSLGHLLASYWERKKKEIIARHLRGGEKQ